MLKINYCLIGLGSNIDNPQQQIEAALYHFKNIKKIKLNNLSSDYQNPALTLIQNDIQPDFINKVILISTSYQPIELLKILNQIERKQNRIRDFKWQARTIDLDILFYNNSTINQANLIIPHYDIYNRNFFVYPILEIIDQIQEENFINYFSKKILYKLKQAEKKIRQNTDFNLFFRI